MYEPLPISARTANQARENDPLLLRLTSHRSIKQRINRFTQTNQPYFLHPEARYISPSAVELPVRNEKEFINIRYEIQKIFPFRHLKLEFYDNQPLKLLRATMPTTLHELLKDYTGDIIRQLTLVKNRRFLPVEFHEHLSNFGSSDIQVSRKNPDGTRSTYRFQPDSGVGFQEEIPFLVVEVAVSQKEEELFVKADRYIKGSKGRIAFVLLVVVERAPRPMADEAESTRVEREDVTTRPPPPRTAKGHPTLTHSSTEEGYDADMSDVEGSIESRTSSGGAASGSDVGEEQICTIFLRGKETLKDGDMIFVHLFESILEPETKKRATRRALPKTKVFPANVTDLPTFSIALPDVSSLDMETKAAEISFAWLTKKGNALVNNIGRLLAKSADSDGLTGTALQTEYSSEDTSQSAQNLDDDSADHTYDPDKR